MGKKDWNKIDVAKYIKHSETLNSLYILKDIIYENIDNELIEDELLEVYEKLGDMERILWKHTGEVIKIAEQKGD